MNGKVDCDKWGEVWSSFCCWCLIYTQTMIVTGDCQVLQDCVVITWWEEGRHLWGFLGYYCRMRGFLLFLVISIVLSVLLGSPRVYSDNYLVLVKMRGGWQGWQWPWERLSGVEQCSGNIVLAETRDNTVLRYSILIRYTQHGQMNTTFLQHCLTSLQLSVLTAKNYVT